MSTKTNRQAPAQNEQTSLLFYEGAKIAFEVINGQLMANATQMCKPFGTKPDNWLRTQQAKELIQELAASQKREATDLVMVRNGGINYGTWFHEELALILAQWLSPRFYLACNSKLKTMIQNGTALLEPIGGVMPIIFEGKPWYPRRPILLSAGYSPRSGSAGALRRHYPEHHSVVYGVLCVTPELAQIKLTSGQARQLELQFRDNNFKPLNA